MTDIPCATYRLQFTPTFGFVECGRILDYLVRLGVSDIYASPIFKARSGSMHGYDVCDPRVMNPELGGGSGFAKLTAKRKRAGLGWMQDIVPNHMAVSGENPILTDVLENGPDSRYFSFFDIEWDHPDESVRGRMLAPFLGGFFGDTLERGEISAGFDEDGFFVRYYELRFPLSIDSYAQALTEDLKSLRSALGRDHPDYIKLLGILYNIKTLSALDTVDERDGQISFIKGMLNELYESSASIREYIDSCLNRINNPAAGEGEAPYARLEDLLAQQRYRLSFWKVASDEINYRRFFSINDLISLRIEDDRVQAETHKLIAEKVADGSFTALRIDHIDGLYDPTEYLIRLRRMTDGAFVLVEKILEFDERIPSFWPIQGTVGYDFMNKVCGTFVQADKEREFSRIYARHSGFSRPFEQMVRDKKRLIIDHHMEGDVDNLARFVKSISSRDRGGFDITFRALKKAIIEVLCAFPVYRTYLSESVSRMVDRTYITTAVNRARKASPELVHELDFLERFLLLQFHEHLTDEDKAEWIRFAMRFQQVTGPLMAKGFEDTALYVMNRLLCLNEVGGAPDRFGLSDREWHDFASERLETWPHTMNATATHDTKRGEDARMRLAALSEIPHQWDAALRAFNRINRRRKRKVGDLAVPDRNDEYFLYQTLLASWPFDDENMGDYTDRLKEYLVKSVREAKVHTEWLKPDTEYEQAFVSFAESIITRRRGDAFLREFLPLQERVAFLGMINSLAQTLFKITAPGFPDFYQGTELWDLSFVDPDNRRPVDFDLRTRLLSELETAWNTDPLGLIRDLPAAPEDGRIKLFLIWRGLRARQTHARLFAEGRYIPLDFRGAYKSHAIGFARELEGRMIVSLAPRFTASITSSNEFPLGDVWADTRAVIPEPVPSGMQNLLTGESLGPASEIPLRRAFERFPAALLEGSSEG